MHARMTTVAIRTDAIAEATRIYQDSVVPSIKQQHGFKGAYLLTDSSSGKGISITLWETQADGQAYEASGSYREQVSKLTQFFTAQPSLETFEVSAQS